MDRIGFGGGGGKLYYNHKKKDPSQKNSIENYFGPIVPKP